MRGEGDTAIEREEDRRKGDKSERGRERGSGVRMEERGRGAER